MNLQPIYPPLREGQRVACCKCGKMGATLADLHGYHGDFYCKDCAECAAEDSGERAREECIGRELDPAFMRRLGF